MGIDHSRKNERKAGLKCDRCGMTIEDFGRGGKVLPLILTTSTCLLAVQFASDLIREQV